MIGSGNSLTAENILNFSYADHIQPRFLQSIQNRLSRRLQRIIMTVACSFKFPFFLAYIRPGNHPSHSPFVLQRKLPGNFAAAIQIFQIESFFISTDLQHRIRRRINDHSSRLYFFLAQFLNNLCSAGAFISNDSFPAAFFQFPNQFRRKTSLCKCLKRLFCFQPHHFPMPGHGIFPVACLPQTCITSDRLLLRLHLSSGMNI